MKPVCVPCEMEYRMAASGVYVFEMYTAGIYRIWSADLHFCQVCNHKILFGYGNKPLMEHFEDGFKEKVEDIKSQALLGKCVIVHAYDKVYRKNPKEYDESVELCTNCDGTGSIRGSVSPDDGLREDCPLCKGTGRKP